MDSEELEFEFGGDSQALEEFASIGYFKDEENSYWQYYVNISAFEPENAGNYSLEIIAKDEESSETAILDIVLSY